MRDRLSYGVKMCGCDEWAELLDEFEDANVFQTVPFCSIKAKSGHIEHLVVRDADCVVAAALVRVTFVPGIGLGNAYVLWGPLWRRKDREESLEAWKRALFALHNEYVVKRGFWLRLRPYLFEEEAQRFHSELGKFGFRATHTELGRRTMVVDLHPSLENLRKGLDGKWRNQLSQSERFGVRVVEGVEPGLFDKFVPPYERMLARKGISDQGDVRSFRRLQELLPVRHKMRVFLGCDGADVCAGAIISGVGKCGIYHFGATDEKQRPTRASYRVQWRVLEWLKETGHTHYDLHGVNPEGNPGVYHFKAGLCCRNGKEVELVGVLDAYAGARGRLAFCAGRIGSAPRLRKLFSIWRGSVVRPPYVSTVGKSVASDRPQVQGVNSGVSS